MGGVVNWFVQIIERTTVTLPEEIESAPTTFRDIIDYFTINNHNWAIMKTPPLGVLEMSLRGVFHDVDAEIRDRLMPSVEGFLVARRAFFGGIDAVRILRYNDDAIEDMLKGLPEYLKTYEELLKRITELADDPDYAEDVFDSGIIDVVVNADFHVNFSVDTDTDDGYPKPYFFSPIMLEHFLLADKIRRAYNEMMPMYSDNFSRWLQKLAFANIRQSFTFATRHNGRTYRYKLGVKAELTKNREINSEISVANLSRHITSEFWTQYDSLRRNNKNNEPIEFRIALIGDVKNNDDLQHLCTSLSQDFSALKEEVSAHITLAVYTNNVDIQATATNFENGKIDIEKKPAVRKYSADLNNDEGFALDKLDGLKDEFIKCGYNAVLFFDNAAFYKAKTLTTKDLKAYNSQIYRRGCHDTPLWVMRTQLMQYEASGEYGFAKCRRFNSRLFKRLWKMANQIYKDQGTAVYAVLSGSDCTSFISECPEKYQEFAVSDEWDMATRVAILCLSPRSGSEPVVLNPDAEDNEANSSVLKLSPSQIFRRVMESNAYHELFSPDLFDGSSDEALKFLKNAIIQLDYSNLHNERKSVVKFVLFNIEGDIPKPMTKETGQKERELIGLVQDFLTAALSPDAHKTIGVCNIRDIFVSAVMRYATHIGSAVFLHFYDAGIMRMRPSTELKYDEALGDGQEPKTAGGDIFALDDAVRTLAVPGYDFRSECAVRSMLKRALSSTAHAGDVDRVYNWMRREVADSCDSLGLSSYALYWNARK